MSLTLNPPTRVAALVVALVLTGVAAFVLFLGRGALGGESTAASDPAPVTRTPPVKTTPKPAARPAKPRVASGFPSAVDHALRYSRVVVVSVGTPGAAVDTVVRREARAGAKASRAGFVALSTTNERAMSALVAKAGVLPSPAVVIVKRPGALVTTFSVTDAGTVAQAVAQARR